MLDNTPQSPSDLALRLFLLVSLCGLVACSGDATVTDSGPSATADAAQPNTVIDAGGTCTPPNLANTLLPGEMPTGNAENTNVDGFNDVYLYSSDGATKIGVRRNWGGSIVFFGASNGAPGMNNTNTIDANDTGREVQVALYDPDRAAQDCAGTASCRTSASTCPASITYLGWNPVQGGNRCNNGSPVNSLNTDCGVQRMVSIPLHWNPNWDFADCTTSGCSDPTLSTLSGDVRLTQTLRFVAPKVVELSYVIENLSNLDHASTIHELPTVYSAIGNVGPDLWRLFDSNGTEVAIDTPAGNADGFFFKNFASAGGWVTLQNSDASYGVGILYENGLTGFQGWQKRSLPFNNVRARFAFGIPANGVVQARAYLALGSLSEISQQLNGIANTLPPFGALDTPAPDAPVSGTVAVGGWALDNRGVTQVLVRVTGLADTPLSYGNARPDVGLVWPGYPGNDGVGYGGSLDVSGLTSGPHTIEIVARDGDGNERVVVSRRLIVQ